MENDLKDLIIEEYYLFFTQEEFFHLLKQIIIHFSSLEAGKLTNLL